MKTEVELIEILKKAILPDAQLPIITGNVKSVDGDHCTVVVDGQELTEVRLKATISSTSLNDRVLLTPKVGSLVLIGSLTGDLKDLCVLKIDELDKVEIKQGDFELMADIGNNKVKLKADEIEFNGGVNDGMVLLHKLESNLNQLKQYAETMNQAVGIALGAIDPMAGSQSFGPYQSTMSSQQIVFENMGNDKIKQ